MISFKWIIRHDLSQAAEGHPRAYPQKPNTGVHHHPRIGQGAAPRRAPSREAILQPRGNCGATHPDMDIRISHPTDSPAYLRRALASVYNISIYIGNCWSLVPLERGVSLVSASRIAANDVTGLTDSLPGPRFAYRETRAPVCLRVWPDGRTLTDYRANNMDLRGSPARVAQWYL